MNAGNGITESPKPEAASSEDGGQSVTHTVGDIGLEELPPGAISEGTVGTYSPPAVHISPATPNASNEEGEDADLLNFVPDRDVIEDVNLKLKMSFLDTDYLDKTEAENRRLLPNTRNRLHIIDGPNVRYHMGIIDFFTLYECRQKVGRVLKSIKFCCGDHSTIPPPAYGDRMYNFIADHTT